MTWWNDAVLYQIYPRSYQDSNGDGIGDLRGIIERLDHLAWLGVDGIWLSPITVSPNADWGYDVSDYRDVDPALGTLADADELIARAGERGIRVLLDLVPNHTSDRHPWFVDARSSRTAARRDWYVWADRPNNWVSTFGGPAWTLDETTGQHYLHNFLAEQPDLNWWNEDVRASFDDILRFWFDRGVAGFRIDVCQMVIKDKELRDNPAATEADSRADQRRGQRQVYNVNRPEVHEIFKRWRRIADEYDAPRLFVGETAGMDIAQMSAYYGSGDELHLPMNFGFAYSRFRADSLRAAVEQTLASIPADAPPVWLASNHDASRFPTRWCGGDDELVRCALTILLMLPGAAILYYGDEIGMTDTALTESDLKDPVGRRWWPGRDIARTPMPWTSEPGAGFTPSGVKPWLPFGDVASRNVAAQRDDPGSILNFCRELIALRRTMTGPYERLPAPDGAWAWRRGDATIAVNLGDAPVVIGSLRLAPRSCRVVT